MYASWSGQSFPISVSDIKAVALSILGNGCVLDTMQQRASSLWFFWYSLSSICALSFAAIPQSPAVLFMLAV